MAWQPIETAPRDGSLFLGWLAAGGYVLCYRHSGEWRFGEKGHPVVLRCWMPLPTPPGNA
jgi:hypothetical protein